MGTGAVATVSVSLFAGIVFLLQLYKKRSNITREILEILFFNHFILSVSSITLPNIFKHTAMKFFLIFLTVIFVFTTGIAQTTEDSVKAIVNNLFTAMKNADAVLLGSCFADSAILQTVVKNKEGKNVVKNELVSEFILFISHEAKGNADERIAIETVKIDGPLAMVWAPYKFYYKGQFSHCGVDALMLVNTAQGWKIQYLIDTRRETGCN